jgi:hypothetical protein
MVKSKIAEHVFRATFAHCVYASPRTAAQANTDAIPMPDAADASETLRNVNTVIQDAGICLHGWTNTGTATGAAALAEAAKSTGAALIAFALLNVRVAFERYPNVRTFIFVMDKGPFMPPPKAYVQTDRAEQSAASLRRRGIEELSLPADGSLPTIVAVNRPLPPWCAVTANRALYRHATAELLDAIVERYTPPPGRRLILDFMCGSATSPADIDAWMCSDRVLCSEYAMSVVAEARELLRGVPDWRNKARALVEQLAQGGHVRSVPICIETTLDGARLASFLLPEASNTVGEADLCIPFWLTAMRSERQHVTLSGRRLRARCIDDDYIAALYYTDAQIAEHNRARECGAAVEPHEVPGLMPLEEQRAAARAEWPRLIDAKRLRCAASSGVHEALGERGLAMQQIETVRDRAWWQHVESLGAPLAAGNPCRAPNRSLVLSRDTDFLPLLICWQAQLVLEVAETAATPEIAAQYAIDHAPLLSLGQQLVHRSGWLQSADDFVDKELLKKEATRATLAPMLLAQEVYDIGRVEQEIASQLDTEMLLDSQRHATPLERANAALSFLVMTCVCGNDYLAGLYYVNRANTLKAWQQVGVVAASALVRRQPGVADADSLWLVDFDQYRDLIKRCYYQSLCAAKSSTPGAPAAALSYDAVGALVRKKYKANEKCHMPCDERLRLMWRRVQWWLVYVTCAPTDICLLLDHAHWGWAATETQLRV